MQILCYFFVFTILYPIAATIIVIAGVIRLKKQYGKYAKVATFKTLACTTAHVFQGTKTDVTVAESWRVRLSKRGSYPSFLYVSENIFPGSNIAIYWSDRVILKKIAVKTVELTRPTALFI